MSFSTAKQAIASNRFTLIRIEPAYYAVDDLVLNGSIYEMTFNYPVSKVYRLGTQLTEDSTTPTVNDHYYYDEANNKIEIKLSAAPSAANVIIVYFYQFFTSEKARRISQDPDDSTTTLRSWQPRLIIEPTFNQSIKNALSGVLTLNSINLGFINADLYFNDFITTNYSYYQKNVEIWIGINSAENLQKIYKGKISDIRFDQRGIYFNVYDFLNKLRQPCLVDASSEAYYVRSIGGFPTIDPNDENLPCPLIYGGYSHYRTKQGIFAYFGVGLTVGYELILDECHRASCTLYQSISTINNRYWGLCRIPDTFDSSYTIGTVTGVSNLSGSNGFGLTTSGHKVRCGMSIKISESGNTDYGRVISADSSSIICATDTTCSYSYTTGATITLYSDVSIIVRLEDGTDIYPLQDRDYSVNTSATSGGNNFISIQFTNNFEANFSGITYLDPNKNKVHYVVYPDPSDSTHQTVVNDLLTAAGVDVDATSITQAGTDLSANLTFSIPDFGETNIKNYTHYLQLILQSTLGYLSLNDSFEISYKIFKAITSGDTINQDYIKLDSQSVKVEFQDVKNEIITQNKTIVDDPVYHAGDPAISENEVDLKARYLHGINDTLIWENVLTDPSTRSADVMNFIKNRNLIYQLKTASENLDSNIGDNVTLTSELIPGATSDNLQIIGLNKNGSETTVVLTDLGDFT